MPINIVKVYEILRRKATVNMASIGGIIKNVATGFFNRTLSRLTGSGIKRGDSRLVQAKAKWSGRGDEKDWRVRLQVPQGSPIETFFDFENNELLKPLAASKGIFWPLTPAVVIQHSANYNALAQTHSNYPFQAYQNSQVDQMNIIGEFPVQNAEDAKHWVATVNFLRTATKMFFGKDGAIDPLGSGLKGNPPPIMHLFGYGDHMFRRVPVVINSFNVELRPGIDYISTKQNATPYKQLTGPDAAFFMNAEAGESQSWAPTLSNISVLLTPIYSRESLSNFSMKSFVNGELNGKGDEIGFI